MENLAETGIQRLSTLANYEHLRHKRQLVAERKDAFIAEGNEFLYGNLYQESEGASQSFDPDTWPVSRFLYHVPTPEEEPTP